MSALRIRAIRLSYRLAFRVLQLAMILTGRRGRGVKCLLTHSGRILLVRHTYGRRDVWYLPGGGVRRGEQPIAAGLREMNEELGLQGLVMHELARSRLRLEHMAVDLTCLHAELDDLRLHPNPVEIAHACWFSLDQLPSPLGSEVERLTALLEREDSGAVKRRALP